MSLIIFLNIVLFLTIFLLYRNQWTYKTRIQNSELVNKMLGEKIENGTYDIATSRDYYFNMLWSYNKMLYHFWIWDLRKMVSDQEKFNELMQYMTRKIGEQEGKVIPFEQNSNPSSL